MKKGRKNDGNGKLNERRRITNNERNDNKSVILIKGKIMIVRILFIL